MVKQLALEIAGDRLSEADTALAAKLQKEHGELVASVKHCMEGEKQMRGLYLDVLKQLRASNLSAHEVTVLLLSLGWRKQRVTEVRRLYEVDDGTWKKLTSGEVSYRQTLAIERAKAPRKGGRKPKKRLRSIAEEKAVYQAIPSDHVALFVEFANKAAHLPQGKLFAYSLKTPNPSDLEHFQNIEVVVKITALRGRRK